MTKVVLRFRAADRRIFDALKTGAKTVETRAATVKFAKIKPGDKLVLICGGERLIWPIQSVQHFRSIDEMLAQVPYQKIMPWATSIKEVHDTYTSFPGYQDKIKKFGIIALG